MLYELDRALTAMAADPDVRVIILAADGPDFSAGHDLDSLGSRDGMSPVTQEGAFAEPGEEGWLAFEMEAYLGLSWRWRNLPKPTIAQVQGRVIGGGLMLVWPCDLIVASTDALFSDPVTAFGVNGGEYFVHPWELGARRAKEMLFTGEPLTANEAASLGMVNRVVEREALDSSTVALAEKIAERPPFGLRLAKASVNQALEAQGQHTAIQAAFALHSIGHAHNLAQTGGLVDPEGYAAIRANAQRPPPR